jgi:hypothetical protein
MVESRSDFMAQRVRDDELYGLDALRLATPPPRAAFERAALALLPEGSKARCLPGEGPQVALPGGPWFRYGTDGRSHSNIRDPREAWEVLFARGVIDAPRQAMRGGPSKPSPLGHRYWVQQDVGHMGIYDLAARQGRTSKDNDRYAIPVHPSVVGLSFAAHPNPFEPLVRASSLGFYVDTLGPSRSVIVGLLADGA